MKASLTAKENVLAIVERATVRLPRLKGRGVLVPGGFVLTAAHCVGWTASGMMVDGGSQHEQVVTPDRTKLLMQVIAVEPVADIAVLCSPDDQQLPDMADAVEAFAENTEAIPLFRGRLTSFRPLAVHVYGLDRRWIGATATAYADNAHRVCIAAERCVEGGASGGPIVTATGELLGVVSNCSEDSHAMNGQNVFMGNAPLLSLALPAWILDATRGKK